MNQDDTNAPGSGCYLYGLSPTGEEPGMDQYQEYPGHEHPLRQQRIRSMLAATKGIQVLGLVKRIFNEGGPFPTITAHVGFYNHSGFSGRSSMKRGRRRSFWWICRVGLAIALP